MTETSKAKFIASQLAKNGITREVLILVDASIEQGMGSERHVVHIPHAIEIFSYPSGVWQATRRIDGTQLSVIAEGKSRNEVLAQAYGFEP